MCRCFALIRAFINGGNILMLKYSLSYPSLVFIIFIFIHFILLIYTHLFFLNKFFYIYFYVVKNVLINPSNREELKVDNLTMVFNISGSFNYVGTTIEPAFPDAISKMFISDFIFLYFCFYLFCYAIFFFLIFL
jgi:hypothetical protein